MSRIQPDHPTLSVVVPCFNETGNIVELVRRAGAACQAVAPDDFEIVLVNDGSDDDTWAEIQKQAERTGYVCGVDLSRNHGHQLALSAGLSVARGDRILILDADLQDPPELLADMMAIMDGGVDVVYGQRTKRHNGESPIRSVASTIFYRVLNRFATVDIPLDTGDFRLISRRVLDHLNAMPEHHRFIRGMISWIGYRQAPILYKRDQRFHGETKYTVGKLFSFAVDAITGFSVRPLHAVIKVGFLFMFLSLVMLMVSVYQWTTGYVPVAGWTSLITAVLLVGSVQICILGIMGEYIGRIFQQSKNRPLFLIRQVLRAERDRTPPV